MIVKLAHIPAYIIHFCMGFAGTVMSLWGMPFVLLAVVIDLLRIAPQIKPSKTQPLKKIGYPFYLRIHYLI